MPPYSKDCAGHCSLKQELETSQAFFHLANGGFAYPYKA